MKDDQAIPEGAIVFALTERPKKMAFCEAGWSLVMIFLELYTNRFGYNDVPFGSGRVSV